MKTLVIIAHSDMETSRVNKRWIQELEKYPEKYTVHELYKFYKEGKIDVEREQKLIESHSNLVIQFPIYWFNCPPLLKGWLDDVLTHGWAFGSNGGNHLMNRKVALAVSAGAKQSDYSEGGRFRYTLKQLLIPFETTFFYCDADYRSFYSYYGKEEVQGAIEEDTEAEENELTKSAREYVEFIDAL
ncbi:NAD(P)H-dependent oxidoreductase [Bacillus sp. JCM 19034]|uniref:NAD(P)H-dependent oxidoreductase n=1 Tax=Bacillus sp. JCM 19034 TaxID=1481928 RepID=UPI0007810C9F|nr:NAD(P)H-dependent oxidoreductase [Bacillus sp. JCM 19034]